MTKRQAYAQMSIALLFTMCAMSSENMLASTVNQQRVSLPSQRWGRNLLCMAEINRMDHSIWAKAFPMDSSDPSDMQQEMGEAASRLTWLSEHGDGTNQTDLAARMAACFAQSRLWLEPEEIFNKTNRQAVCMNLCRTIQDATPGFPGSKKGTTVDEEEPEENAAALSAAEQSPGRMEDGLLFLSAPSPSVAGLRGLTSPQQQAPPLCSSTRAFSCPWQLRRTDAAARAGCLELSLTRRLRGGMSPQKERQGTLGTRKKLDADGLEESDGGGGPSAAAPKGRAKKARKEKKSKGESASVLSGEKGHVAADGDEEMQTGGGKEEGGLLSGLLAEAGKMVAKQRRREMGEGEEEEESELSGNEGDWARMCKSMGWERDKGRGQAGGKNADRQARRLGLQLLRICDKVSEELDPMTELGKFEVDVDAATACIEQGADVNLGGEFDLTALHMLCAADGHQLLVSRLIQAGADVTLRDVAGNTPLHEAVRYRGEGDVRCLETVALLLKAGADPLAEDGSGQTARQMAEEALARHEWVGGMQSNVSKNAREIVKLVGGDEWHGWKEFNRRFRRQERKKAELEKRRRKEEGKVDLQIDLAEMENEVVSEAEKGGDDAAIVKLVTVEKAEDDLEQRAGGGGVESSERMEEDQEQSFGGSDNGEPSIEGNDDW